MFFIYLFFGIGVLATLVLMLPSILAVIVYLNSLFANFKYEKDNQNEVRKKVLEKKHEIKLAKIEEKYQAKQDKIDEVKEEVEEVIELPEVEEQHEEVATDSEVVAPYNYNYSTEE